MNGHPSGAVQGGKARRVLVVGAGMAGAVLARGLAEAGGYDFKVIDRRGHVAGNCHTERDAKNGVMEHVHGPHIFNTNHDDVWAYVQRFGEWVPHVNRVKAVTTRSVFPFRINLRTLNQYSGRLTGPKDVRVWLDEVRDRTIATPRNFEEQALSQIGRGLYETFLRDYTRKQWGVEPDRLPASLLRRLPVRFDENDSYYATRYHAMPRGGYTAIVRAILDYPRIELALGESFNRAAENRYSHVYYSGATDACLEHRLGRLGYRTVTFQRTVGIGDIQGDGVLNYLGRRCSGRAGGAEPYVSRSAGHQSLPRYGPGDWQIAGDGPRLPAAAGVRAEPVKGERDAGGVVINRGRRWRRAKC